MLAGPLLAGREVSEGCIVCCASAMTTRASKAEASSDQPLWTTPQLDLFVKGKWSRAIAFFFFFFFAPTSNLGQETLVDSNTYSTKLN